MSVVPKVCTALLRPNQVDLVDIPGYVNQVETVLSAVAYSLVPHDD